MNRLNLKPLHFVLATFGLVLVVACFFFATTEAQTTRPRPTRAPSKESFRQQLESALANLDQQQAAQQGPQNFQTLLPNFTQAQNLQIIRTLYVNDAQKGIIVAYHDFDGNDSAGGLSFFKQFDGDIGTQLLKMNDGRIAALTARGELFVLTGDIFATKTQRFTVRDFSGGLALDDGFGFDKNHFLIGTGDRLSRVPEYQLNEQVNGGRGPELSLLDDKSLRRGLFRPDYFFPASIAMEPSYGWPYMADPYLGKITIGLRPGQPYLDSLLPDFPAGIVAIGFEPGRRDDAVLYIVTPPVCETSPDGNVACAPDKIYRAHYFKDPANGARRVSLTEFAYGLDPEGQDKVSFSPFNGILPVGNGKLYVIVGGSIRMLRDTNGDGVADINKTFVPSSLTGTERLAGLATKFYGPIASPNN